MYHHRRCCKWLPPASIQSCARVIVVRYTRCNIVILMAATAWLILSFSSCIVCGFDSYTVLFKCPQRNFLWGHLKSTVNISHAVAAIKITMLHRVYFNMVTARLLTNCSNTLHNIHTNARENITRTRAKRKAGYFFVAHSVLNNSSQYSVFVTNRKVYLVNTNTRVVGTLECVTYNSQRITIIRNMDKH